jgi:hypothetical protein
MDIKVEVNVYTHDSGPAPKWAIDMAAGIAAIASAVTAEGSQISDLKQQISGVLSGLALPPEVQAKIDQAFAAAEANKASLAALTPKP